MSGSQSSKRKRREFPSKDTDPTLRELASTLILLDVYILWTLRDTKSSLYEKFWQQVKDPLDKINHDSRSSRYLLSAEIKPLVTGLSAKNLDRIITRPIESQFYCEAIHLRMKACETAKEEAEMLFEEMERLGAEEDARQDLRVIVDTFRSLYAQVNNVAAEDHLQHTVKTLKQPIQIINRYIENACDYLDDLHQPLVDGTDIKEIHHTSTNSPTKHIIEQKKTKSALAFLIAFICALSAIPACFALAHAENEPGNALDSDFFQLLASTPIQLLGISTSLWPIINKFRPDRAAWVQSWTLATISACLTIASIPLYILVSPTLSGYNCNSSLEYQCTKAAGIE